MPTVQYLKGDTEPVIAPVATATAVALGDLVGLSSGNVVRAEDETWVTDLATTQGNFVTKFLGVSAQRKTANVARVDGAGEDNRIRVDPEGVFEFDCASASFDVGALVGPAKQTGNALESQKVVSVANESLAIGRVFEKTTSATRVKVKLLSAKMPSARAINSDNDVAAAIASLTDNSGGTANDTIQDLGTTYTEAEVANNFADVTAKINAILAALRTAGIIAT